jgi:signal transduction histidine kinase
MASHELKTPVTSIKLFAELVARHREKVDVDTLGVLLRQADQLTTLINDLLDVSRLQLGSMPMEMRPVDLAALTRETCRRRRALCDKDHTVPCSTSPEAIVVNGDPVRLEQVLTNLVDNAHKYAPSGSRIRVRACRKDGHALVVVQDEGPGIAPEHMPHIFERFYKPGPQQAVYSGLGVGLYISKEIVERHGGRIWAESEPGKGSRFYVELPLAG